MKFILKQKTYCHKAFETYKTSSMGKITLTIQVTRKVTSVMYAAGSFVFV